MKKYRFSMPPQEWTEQEICDAINIDLDEEHYEEYGDYISDDDFAYFMREIIYESIIIEDGDE